MGWAVLFFNRGTLSPVSAGLVSLDTRPARGCGIRGTSAAASRCSHGTGLNPPVPPWGSPGQVTA